MMRLIQRIRSKFLTPWEITERINVLQIELSQRGITFRLEEAEEDGVKFLFAKSLNYPKGCILATGKNKHELAENVKDAIFSAFSIPSDYCNPKFINIDFDGALSDQNLVASAPVHVAA